MSSASRGARGGVGPSYRSIYSFMFGTLSPPSYTESAWRTGREKWQLTRWKKVQTKENERKTLGEFAFVTLSNGTLASVNSWIPNRWFQYDNIYIYIYIWVTICLYVCVCVYLSLCTIHTDIYVFVCVFLCPLYICASFSLSLFLSLSLSLISNVYIYIYIYRIN